MTKNVFIFKLKLLPTLSVPIGVITLTVPIRVISSEIVKITVLPQTL